MNIFRWFKWDGRPRVVGEGVLQCKTSWLLKQPEIQAQIKALRKLRRYHEH